MVQAEIIPSDLLSFGSAAYSTPIPQVEVWCIKMVQDTQKASKWQMRPVVLCVIPALLSQISKGLFETIPIITF